MLTAIAVTMLAQQPAPPCPPDTISKRTAREARCLDVEKSDQGPYVRWYPDGQLVEVGQYEHGKRTGVWTNYHPNGQVAWRAKYADDVRDGPYISYDEKGQVLEEGAYEKGKRVGPWKGRVDGGEVEEKQYVAGDEKRENLTDVPWFPVQGQLTAHMLVGDKTSADLVLNLSSVFGEAHFGGAREGKGAFIGFGLSGEFEVLGIVKCETPCRTRWAVGPSFRYGHAEADIAPEEKVPKSVAPDSYLFAQIAALGGMLSTPTFPLTRPYPAFGARIDVGYALPSWTRGYYRQVLGLDNGGSGNLFGPLALFALALGVFNHVGVSVEVMGSRTGVEGWGGLGVGTSF